MKALPTLLCLLLVMSPVFAAMVDPSIDGDGPFSYLAKPSTEIGVLGGPEGTQITFDGALYTGAAELCFFCGPERVPMMGRVKQLAEGWLPIVSWSFLDGPVAYEVEAFAATLDGRPTSNTVNFVRVQVRNTSDQPAASNLTGALRFTGGDHRCDRMASGGFSPDWRYAMTEDTAIRDGKVVCWFKPGAQREAVPGVPYTKPFVGREYDVSERAEVCLFSYPSDLGPRGVRTYYFRMPLVPIPADDAAQVKALQRADYDEYRQQTVAFWRDELGKGAQVTIPEAKVLDTHRASLVYDLIAIDEQPDGAWVQKVNELQYDSFWLRDGAYIVRSYDVWGHTRTAEKCLEYFRRFQGENGLFSSQGGQLDGYGQALYSLGDHYLLTGDLDWAKKVYPHFPPAVEWLKKTRAADQYHLMPPTNAHDNEGIEGRYTGHNFWALLGLRTAVRLAQATGQEADARSFRAEYDDYLAALRKRISDVCGKDGYIPPGLDVKGGNDWGNLLGVFPAEVMDPFDPRITTTLERMHRAKYREGIMTYGSGLHQYLTTNVTQNHVYRGEQEQALRDFYSMLAHTGSCHEGFELGAQPWGNRDVGGNYTPHGWCAAQINNLLRNMLIQERGGEGGLGPREVHLFTVISPAWAVPGQEVSFRDMPTEMGKVSATLRFTGEGAFLTIHPRFRTAPAQVVVHVPYFVTLQGFTTDATTAERRGDTIMLSPDATRVNLRWTRRDLPPLSYDTVVQDYKREYGRRYAEYVKAGNKPLPVVAPSMLTELDRKAEFARRWGPEAIGIAVGKPVRTNGGSEGDRQPERAVDGNAYDRDTSAWFAAPPTPRWLEVDLQRPTRIDRVQVFTYWGDGRYYQYTVEVSPDGKAWTQVADMSKNTKAASAQGNLHRFAPCEARFVRINLLHNSANPSVHLVELRVFAAP